MLDDSFAAKRAIVSCKPEGTVPFDGGCSNDAHDQQRVTRTRMETVMRMFFKALLVSAAILAPLSVAVAADMESAPVNLMGSELLQMAQAGGSGVGGASGSGSSSMGSSSVGGGSSGKGSTGLNPRIGSGSSSGPSKSPADDMAKQRDEDKRLRDKEKSKGTTP